MDSALEDIIQIAIKSIDNKKPCATMKHYKEEFPTLSFEVKTLEIIKRHVPVYDIYDVKIDGENFGIILNRNGWEIDNKGHSITEEDKAYLITKAQSIKGQS